MMQEEEEYSPFARLDDVLGGKPAPASSSSSPSRSPRRDDDDDDDAAPPLGAPFSPPQTTTVSSSSPSSPLPTTNPSLSTPPPSSSTKKLATSPTPVLRPSPPVPDARSRLIEPEYFWTEHETWLKTVDLPKDVRVGDPLVPPRTFSDLNPPVTYLVTTSSPHNRGGGVRHRYSDFELLRASLSSRFVGILIPALPEKKVNINASEQFLEARSRGLTAFLQGVLSNPYLASDNLTQIFLNGSLAEWEMAKRGVEIATAAVAATNANSAGTGAGPTPQYMNFSPSLSSSSSSPLTAASTASAEPSTSSSSPLRYFFSSKAPSTPIASPPAAAAAAAEVTVSTSRTSEERWRSAISMYSLPPNYETEIRAIKRVLIELDSLLKTLVHGAVKCAAAAKAYALAINDVYSQVEKMPSNSVAKKFDTTLATWAEGVGLQTVLTEELLVESLRCEHENVKEMLVMLDARDELVAYADRCLRVLHKYEVEKEGFERSGAADRVAKAEIRIQDAHKQCKAADYRSEFVTKAFFLGGVEKFASERTREITKIFTSLSLGQIRHSEFMTSAWTAAISSLGSNLESSASESQDKFRALDHKVPEKFKGVFLVDVGGTSSASSAASQTATQNGSSSSSTAARGGEDNRDDGDADATASPSIVAV